MCVFIHTFIARKYLKLYVTALLRWVKWFCDVTCLEMTTYRVQLKRCITIFAIIIVIHITKQTVQWGCKRKHVKRHWIDEYVLQSQYIHTFCSLIHWHLTNKLNVGQICVTLYIHLYTTIKCVYLKVIVANRHYQI